MLRNIAKICVFQLLHLWLQLTAVFMPRDNAYALVLMYHSVEDSDWKYGVSPRNFERQIAYLKKHYDVVHLDEVVSYAKGEKKVSRPTVAVTIDDGYEDTYTAAFPILKKYNVPSTVFLTTNLSVNEKLGNLPRPTKEQIREMHDSGLIRFEVHGRDHKDLRKMDVESSEFTDEVLGCRDDLESMTGWRAKYVAYASGNRGERVQQKIKEFGFEAGFGITDGLIQQGDNLFILRRVQVDRTIPFMLFKLRATRAVATYRAFVQFWQKVFRKIKMIGRETVLYVHKPKEDWEHQFERGYWDFLLANQPHTQATASYIQKHATALSRPVRVLDLGCGNGALAALLSKDSAVVGEYTGVDISEKALADAKEVYPEGTFHQCDLRSSLPALDDTDVIVCNEVLYYVSPVSFLRRLKKAAHPSHRIIFSIYKTWRRPILLAMVSLFFNVEHKWHMNGNGSQNWIVMVVRV